jgi:hypothetical protein
MILDENNIVLRGITSFLVANRGRGSRKRRGLTPEEAGCKESSWSFLILTFV